MYIARWMLVLGLMLSATIISAGETDADAIRQLMRHSWERADAPLEVNPVTVEADYAVAGWTQGERGGRALLRRAQEGWHVVICAGDALLDPTTLRDAGLDAGAADQLAASVVRAEQGVPAERRQQFASFQGTMRVDGVHGQPAH